MITKSKKGIKVYSTKKTTKKKKRLSDKLKEYKNPDGTRKESSIEKKIREWLESSGIYFKQEKFLQYKGKWKSYDFIVTDGLNYTFLIEADGEYFHPDEQKRNLNKMQKKNQKNDLFKDELAEKFGIPLLRFREKEIRNNFHLVAEKILAEIKRQSGN